MLAKQSLWTFLKTQQERLTLLASLLSFLVGIGKSLVDKSNPPVLSLTLFSIFAFAYCVWTLVARRAEDGPPADVSRSKQRRYSTRRTALTWTLSALSLGAAWSFIYRDHLLYSSTVARLLGSKRVLVSDAVAWQILRYQTPAGERTNTVVAELASLLSRLPYRPTVLRHSDWSTLKVTERDGFSLKGLSETLGMFLEASMFITKPRDERLIEEVQKDVTLGALQHSENTVSGLLPVKLFFRNQFLFSHFTVSIPLPSDTPADVRTQIARLVIRYAVATMLYYDADPGAPDAFREVLRVGKLLPAMKSDPLAGILKATGYYLAVHGASLDEALAALDLARTLATQDPELDIMQCYLLIASGRTEEARERLEQLRPRGDNAARYYELKGEYYYTIGQWKETIGPFETALQSERDDHYRALLHLNIALAYGRSEEFDDHTRAAEMIKHLEDGIQLKPTGKSAMFHILQGFAWALDGDATLARRAFQRASTAATKPSEKRLLAYWFGRSLLLLGHSSEAVEELQKAIGDPEHSGDADLLLVLAESLAQIEGKEDTASRYLDRVFELEPNNGKAHRYRGLILAQRAQRSSSDASRQRALNEEARTFLLKSIRLGDEGARTHEVLAALYEQAGDLANAQKHTQRLCELDPQSRECVFREAERLAQQGDAEGARRVLQRARRRDPKNESVLLREGMIWYKAGKLAEAEAALTDALVIAPRSFEVHDNLAFVLFDRGRFKEALAHWERALRLSPSEPDALAGKAIALRALGDRKGAIAAYRVAAQKDPRFLDCEALRRESAWSDLACRAAVPLIEALGRTESDYR